MTTEQKAAATERKARAALQEVGSRRGKLTKETASLRRDTKRALKGAKKANIPTGEAATLVGVSRSTAYEVYLGADNGTAADGPKSKPGNADGGSAKGKRNQGKARKVQGADAKASRRRQTAGA